MEKIVVALNAEQFNLTTIDFACYLAKLTGSRLTALLLEDVDGEAAPMPMPELAVPVGTAVISSSPAHKEFVEKKIAELRAACSNRGVACSFKWTRGNPENEVTDESRFADLLVIDPALSFEEQLEGTPTRLAKKILSKSECPIVIAPYTFDAIDEVVFAYDGGRSSVFALKMFSYLFPELSEKKLTVLSIVDAENDFVLQKEKIRELVQMHYSNTGYQILQGKASDELFGYLVGKKNIIVIMGAFGRTMLSGLFHNSTAELVIKVTNLPVFIAHH
jgi:hypothetical protein